MLQQGLFTLVRAGQHMVVLSLANGAHAGVRTQKLQHGLYTPFASGQQSPSSPSVAQPGWLAHVALAWGSTIGGLRGYLQVCGTRLLVTT